MPISLQVHHKQPNFPNRETLVDFYHEYKTVHYSRLSQAPLRPGCQNSAGREGVERWIVLITFFYELKTI